MADVANTQKFQSWELNGRGKPRGVWPLPQALTPEVYTEVDTDRRGHILGVREFKEGSEAPLVRSFHLDERGRVESQSYTDPVSGISGKNVYEYDAKGIMKARSEQDPRGQVRYRIEVTCDAAGRFLEEKVLEGVSKRPVMRHVYTLDGAGNTLKDEAFVGRNLDQLQGFHALTYDKKSRITRRAWHDANGAEVEAFVYTYDELDRRVVMAIEKAGKVTMTATTTFDATGRQKVAYTTPDGKPVRGAIEDQQQPLPKPEDIQKSLDQLQNKVKEVVSKDPTKLNAIAQVAYSQLEAGQYNEARKLFESLTVLDPASAYYLSAVGATALLQDQSQTALNYFERALTRDPRHLSSMVGRADALLRLGKVDGALEQLQVAFKTGPASDPVLRRAHAMVKALTEVPAKAAPAQKAAPAKAGPPAKPARR